MPVLLISMDLSVLFLAIPVITADLAPTSSQMLWILDIYGFILAGLLITMGNLGDRFGRRKVLLLGAVVFGFASVMAAFSTTPEVLIAARALMGIGGATLMPSTLSLIRNMFEDPSERAKAIGIWTAAFAGGGAFGPVAGGALLSFFDWGSVFLINVPFLIGLLIAAPILVPEFRNPSSARFDFAGAVLSMAAVLLLVYSAKHAAEITGWDARSSISLIVGAAVAALFFIRQRSASNPLVDTTLFKNRRFVGALIAVTLGIMMLLGPNMYLAQYLQLALGFSPLAAALWMIPMTAAAMAGSLLAPKLSRTIGTATAVSTGFVLAAAGLGVIAFTPTADGLAVVVGGGVVLGAGITTVMTLATDVIMAAAPPDRAGAASAIQETGSELGGALGIALMGSIGAAVYKTSFDLPVGSPPIAQESFSSAREVSRSMPEDLGTALFDNAAAAFTSGLSIAAVAGSMTMLALAVVVPMLMRGASTSAESISLPIETYSHEKDSLK